MIKKNSICIIPAKGCSTRLPRKNLLPLGGHPMLAHSIRKAIASQKFDVVCVSTEDSEIAAVAREYGAEVPFLRPEHLSRDPSTIVDVILHALDEYEKTGVSFQRAVVLLPTSPFVTISHINEAHALYEKTGAESLLSVTKTEFPPFNAWLVSDSRLKPCFPDSPFKSTKSTECPNTYRSNGAILIVDVPKFRRARSYRELDLVAFVMPQEVSLDIDTRLEYDFARFLVETGSAHIDSEIFP